MAPHRYQLRARPGSNKKNNASSEEAAKHISWASSSPEKVSLQTRVNRPRHRSPPRLSPLWADSSKAPCSSSAADSVDLTSISSSSSLDVENVDDDVGIILDAVALRKDFCTRFQRRLDEFDRAMEEHMAKVLKRIAPGKPGRPGYYSLGEGVSYAPGPTIRKPRELWTLKDLLQYYQGWVLLFLSLLVMVLVLRSYIA